MSNSLSFRSIFEKMLFSVRENLQIFAYCSMILALGNYIFIRLSAASGIFTVLHMCFLYVFYYMFFRIYFNKKPLWQPDVFAKSIGRIFIILLLAFFSVALIKIAFELLYFLAKSLSVFPNIYNFLAGVYGFIKTSVLVKIALVLFILSISLFTVFIPCFSWLAMVIEKDSSILFSIIETKGKYLNILSFYILFYALTPLLLTSILIVLGFPVIIICFFSAIVSILQMIMYAEIYKVCFVHRLLNNKY